MGALIGYSNQIDSATLTGGSWTTGLPLNSLKTRILGQLARTTTSANASSTFNIDFATPKNIQVVSLVNHNISLDGQIRIRGSNDNWATTSYDSGVVDVWPAVYTFGTLEWEEDAWWSGKYTADEITGYTTNIVHIVPVLAILRYWQIDILDSTNIAGYLQLGRVFMGQTWTPTRDVEVGLSLGWETSTTVQKALSGTKYFQHRTPYRVTKFSLSTIDLDEALIKAFEIDRRMGIDGEVIWVQSTTDTVHALRRRFLGTIREMSAIEFPYSQYGSKSYTIEESL